MLYDGIEAERLVLGTVSIGARQDVQHASELDEAMATTLGIGNDEGGVPRSFARTAQMFGSVSAKQIDEAVIHILTKARDRARSILTEHQDELTALRDLLLQTDGNTLDTVQLSSVVKGR